MKNLPIEWGFSELISIASLILKLNGMEAVSKMEKQSPEHKARQFSELLRWWKKKKKKKKLM